VEKALRATVASDDNGSLLRFSKWSIVSLSTILRLHQYPERLQQENEKGSFVSSLVVKVSWDERPK